MRGNLIRIDYGIVYRITENEKGNLIIAGDLNVRVGREAETWNGIIGKCVKEKQNK